MRWIIFSAVLLLAGVAFAADVMVFTSPDSSYDALRDFLDGAKELKIATYTFDSPYIMDELIKLGNIANITVLVEKSPVGGLKNKEILCELENNGIDVYLYDGSARFMHAKYVIKNGKSVLVSTENFGYSGFPRNRVGNRGWGAIVSDEKMEFYSVFNYDLNKSVPFICDISDYDIEYNQIGASEPMFEGRIYHNQNISFVFAPHATDSILEIINSAKDAIYIEQFYIYRYWDGGRKYPSPFLSAAIERARQGVDVKILLDSTWYNIDKDDINSNLNTADYINLVASSENISLEAKLADHEGIGAEKLHIKGIIIDEKAVFVSSINWNENSPVSNREAGVLIKGDAAGYFTDAFMYDWNDGKKESATMDWWILAITLVISAIVLFFLIKR